MKGFVRSIKFWANIFKMRKTRKGFLIAPVLLPGGKESWSWKEEPTWYLAQFWKVHFVLLNSHPALERGHYTHFISKEMKIIR